MGREPVARALGALGIELKVGDLVCWGAGGKTVGKILDFHWEREAWHGERLIVAAVRRTDDPSVIDNPLAVLLRKVDVVTALGGLARGSDLDGADSPSVGEVIER